VRFIGTMAALLLVGCKNEGGVDPTWKSNVEKFHARREKSIGGEEGWISLVGRFALKPGANTLGSDPQSDAVLPADRSPPKAGTFVVEEGQLSFVAGEGADVRSGGKKITTLTVSDDGSGKPTVLELGSLRMHVIKRGGQFFLRVKDREHPARATFKGLTWYPLEPKWRLVAKFEPAPEGTTLPVLNVLNQTEDMKVPGYVSFEAEGKTHRLTALKDGDDPGLFIIFKDKTAGHGTYPAGRFLDAPDPKGGQLDLDFNFAYSPPCAFTNFATCPLPPRENHLPIEIAAGETYAGSH
jgi:uncharacterized protein